MQASAAAVGCLLVLQRGDIFGCMVGELLVLLLLLLLLALLLILLVLLMRLVLLLLLMPRLVQVGAELSRRRPEQVRCLFIDGESKGEGEAEGGEGGPRAGAGREVRTAGRSGLTMVRRYTYIRIPAVHSFLK